MDGASPSSAGSSSWWVRSVRLGGREESEDPIAGGKTSFLFIIKQKQPCRGKTDWQGRAGQDTRHKTSNIWQRTHSELQTPGDYKGSK